LLESEHQSLWRSHADSVNRDLIARLLPPQQTGLLLKTDIFDEAFGDGLYPFLQSRSRRFIGIDLSSRVLATARSRYHDLDAVAADIRRLPFADCTFDIVISISTLDHFPSRDDIMTGLPELYRVLKPSGRLIITLDNPVNPFIALRRIIPFGVLNRLGIVPYYVGATLNPRQLKKNLEKTGFTVTRTEAIMHCPRVFAVALSRLFERHASPAVRRRFLGVLTSFERLSALPTRYITGHFVAADAVRN